MLGAPELLYFDKDDARAARVAELVRHARPDILFHRTPYIASICLSPQAPDVALVPAAAVHAHHQDGQRVIVLCEGPAPARVPREARVVRTPSELLEALAAWSPPSAQRLEVVLAINDDLPVRRVLTRLFEEHLGVRVVTAEDHASGLAAAHRERPDVVISDLRGPGGSGREFVEALLAHEPLHDTPVIIYSARARHSGFGDWAGTVGLVALLNLPSQFFELLDAVAFALGRTTSERWDGSSHPRRGYEIPLDPRTLPVNTDWRRRRRDYLDARARLRR